jgi:hypothetical protein
LRLSLSDFEELRKNPAALKQKKLSGEQGGPTYSPSAALRNAIMWMHKNGKSRLETIAELEHKYWTGDFGPRVQKTDATLANLIGQLEDYLDDHARWGRRPVHLRERFSLPLPSDVAEAIRITGEIPLIETSPNGLLYVWFWATKPANWHTELRFPVIQAAVADQVGAPYDEVFVGVYCFEDGLHHEMQFSSNEIAAARNELVALLRLMT